MPSKIGDLTGMGDTHQQGSNLWIPDCVLGYQRSSALLMISGIIHNLCLNGTQIAEGTEWRGTDSWGEVSGCAAVQTGVLVFTDTDRPVYYYMALIDILTHYGMKKRTANAAKQVKHGSGAEISTVKPEQYAKRFTDFVNKILVWHMCASSHFYHVCCRLVPNHLFGGSPHARIC